MSERLLQYLLLSLLTLSFHSEHKYDIVFAPQAVEVSQKEVR